MKRAAFCMTGVLIAWIFSPFAIKSLVSLWAIEVDELSSYFTASAALFSALAFGALLYTLVLQREQLKVQQEELDKAKQDSERNTEIAAYTAMLNYYMCRGYSKDIVEITPADIAKRLNTILGSPTRDGS